MSAARPLAAALVALTALAAASSASARPADPAVTPALRGVEGLDGYRGQVLITRRSSKGSTKLRLVTGRTSRDLSVAPGMSDASIGTQADGTPVLVFLRCRPGGSCRARTAALSGRGERTLDLGADPSCDPASPRLSRGVLAFIASGSACPPGIYLKRPGAPTTRLIDNSPPPGFGDTDPDTVTRAIDLDGDVLLERREGSSLGEAEIVVRVRRIGGEPTTLLRTSWDAEMSEPSLVASVQLEGAAAYWRDTSGFHRAAPAVGGRRAKVRNRKLDEQVAVAGSQIYTVDAPRPDLFPRTYVLRLASAPAPRF